MDTIAAISTAAAPGAIGIIRVSGPKTLEIISRVFIPRGGTALFSYPSHTLVLGELYGPDGAVIDHPLGVYMGSPDSYTGEDMAELHCHGSLVVMDAALRALYAHGARPAEPGEFTKRAFLNGQMDLLQAESVIDLITAESSAAAKNAAAQLEGVMSRRLGRIYGTLVDIAAHFQAKVDYPDEDIDSFDTPQALRTLRAAGAELSDLYGTYDYGVKLRDGISAAIIGRPNVGKSSLLNALLGYDRVIVTPFPGTTRDTVEESVRMGGVILKVSDTAGIRNSADVAERLGVSRALSAAQSAELVLLVVDNSGELTDEDRLAMDAARGANVIVIINKCDLPRKLDAAAIEAAFLHVCEVSALDGRGLDKLNSLIYRLFENAVPADAGEIITNARHAAAVRTARDAVERAAAAMRSGMTPDAALSDVEQALSELGGILGRNAPSDLTDSIFSRFCVGK